MKWFLKRGFFIFSADIVEVASRKRDSILARDDIQKLQNGTQKEMETFRLIRRFLEILPDESHALFYWAVREIKRGRINRENYQHAIDIVTQGAKWLEWCKQYHRLNPDYMSKTFDFSAMEKWVYDMNGQFVDVQESENGLQWENPITMYRYEDGWRIDLVVTKRDLAQEGELMGHCVGGYGYCENVQHGRSVILSLRDKRGYPHVTIELQGDYRDYLNNPTGEWNVIQIRGKGNTEPIDEYKERIKEYFLNNTREHSVLVYITQVEDLDNVSNMIEDPQIYGMTIKVHIDIYSTIESIIETLSSSLYKSDGEYLMYKLESICNAYEYEWPESEIKEYVNSLIKEKILSRHIEEIRAMVFGEATERFVEILKDKYYNGDDISSKDIVELIIDREFSYDEIYDIVVNYLHEFDEYYLFFALKHYSDVKKFLDEIVVDIKNDLFNVLEEAWLSFKLMPALVDPEDL